jgi:hypothetical protein
MEDREDYAGVSSSPLRRSSSSGLSIFRGGQDGGLDLKANSVAGDSTNESTNESTNDEWTGDRDNECEQGIVGEG